MYTEVLQRVQQATQRFKPWYIHDVWQRGHVKFTPLPIPPFFEVFAKTVVFNISTYGGHLVYLFSVRAAASPEGFFSLQWLEAYCLAFAKIPSPALNIGNL